MTYTIYSQKCDEKLSYTYMIWYDTICGLESDICRDIDIPVVTASKIGAVCFWLVQCVYGWYECARVHLCVSLLFCVCFMLFTNIYRIQKNGPGTSNVAYNSP